MARQLGDYVGRPITRIRRMEQVDIRMRQRSLKLGDRKDTAQVVEECELLVDQDPVIY